MGLYSAFWEVLACSFLQSKPGEADAAMYCLGIN